MESIFTKIHNLTEEHYSNLKLAVETGRWHTGERLTLSQRQHAIQALLLYEVKFKNNQDHLTVSAEGNMNFLSKEELKKQLKNQ